MSFMRWIKRSTIQCYRLCNLLLHVRSVNAMCQKNQNNNKFWEYNANTSIFIIIQTFKQPYLYMQDQYQRLHQAQQPQSRGILLTAIQNQIQDFMFERERDETIDSSKKYKRPAFIVDYMENTYIDMKKSFEYVGDNSTFQKRITSILVVQWIAFSYMVNSMAVLFRSPNFLCKVPLTDKWISCTAREACPYMGTEFVKANFQTSSWLNFYQTSITEEFKLICANQTWAPFSQSMFFLGGFVSGYLFSYFSSKIGRRSILLLIMIMIISSIFVCAFAVNFQMFLVGYFFIGFTFFGYETSVYIYIGEISAIRFRTISINMLTMVWAGTPIFLPLLSLIPTWRYTFILFAGVMCITFPLAYKCFLESPRFLVSKQCYSQARQIFKKISITNRRPPYNFKLIQQIQFQNETYLKYGALYLDAMRIIVSGIIDDKKQLKQYNFLDLFKYASLKKITLVLMYWWMFRFFMYFGLNLALQSILHSRFLLTVVIAIAGVAQVLGSFGITLMTTILYRKYKLDIMKTSLLIITLCCTIMWFLKIKIQCKNLTGQNYEVCVELIIMIFLVICIKFFNTIFFSGLIGYYSEVFPTPVRSIGCGFTLTFGRLGTIIVPFYINEMKLRYTQKNSLSFLAPFGLIAFLLCCIMPYTEQSGMRETIEEEHHQEMIQMR